MKEPTVETTEALYAILKRITFRPSCIDMGWRWDVETITKEELSATMGFIAVPRGWLIKCSFQRPDTDTGVIGRGYGRPEYVHMGATESAVVKTAWVCVQMTVHHELMEAFCFDGKRLFDPHKTVEELTANPRK